MLELLSPAGSPEAVVAAVQSGADAIYLGLGGFNARRGAKNFTDQEFLDSVKYCRERGCKVYVTLNTLASDREMEEVAELGRFVSEAGVDAAIVQDLGVARVLRAACPDLPLHASTQMSVHNLGGVHAAAQMGITRVVLARELTLDQIAIIASRSPIEVEVFVHGALCFCHSGQCYMSALIGRRSGNRGMCAQPCRLQYSMGRRMGDYPMSLKDNCLVEYLEALDKAGVACIKIEGRMKRPEYTAIVTEIYAKAMREGKSPSEADYERLTAAFSRDGFTDGYLTGKKEDMFGVRGEADKGANKLFTEARRRYANTEERRVGIDFCAIIQAGRNAQLLAQDSDGNRAIVEGPRVAKAEKAALTEQSVRDQLYKTGGTPFRCNQVICRIDPGVFLSAAAINNMRREAIAQMLERRATPPARRHGRIPPLPDGKRQAKTLMNIQIMNHEQLTPELAELDIANLYVPLEVLSHREALVPFVEKGINIVAILPRVITDTEIPKVREMLEKLPEMGINEVLLGNIGHIALAKQCGLGVRGDFGLNVFNSHTLSVLSAAGLLSATASFELRMAQVRDMAKSMDTELIVYGRLPLMVSDQCIIKEANGSCSCEKGANMSDRMGSVFPVVREFGCRNVILNAHKLFLGDKMEDVRACGVWAARLMFTTETPRECLQVAKAYLGMNEYKPNGITRGLYYRGVE